MGGAGNPLVHKAELCIVVHQSLLAGQYQPLPALGPGIGNGLLQQLPGSGNLYSFRDAVYGTYDKQGQFHQNRTISSRTPLLPFSEPLNLLQPAPLLQLTAGVGGSLPEIPDYIQAIFYACYHSGTICTDASFQAFAAKAADRQIPVYLTGCRSDTLDYDTVKQWQALQVQPLYDIAPIAAYCKSWIQVSIGKSEKLI